MRAQKILPEETAWEIELSGEITELIPPPDRLPRITLWNTAWRTGSNGVFSAASGIDLPAQETEERRGRSRERIMAIASELKFRFKPGDGSG